jgi:hypothetical protein
MYWCRLQIKWDYKKITTKEHNRPLRNAAAWPWKRRSVNTGEQEENLTNHNKEKNAGAQATEQSAITVYYYLTGITAGKANNINVIGFYVHVCEFQEFALINNGYRHLLIILLLHCTCSFFTFPSSALFFLLFCHFFMFSYRNCRKTTEICGKSVYRARYKLDSLPRQSHKHYFQSQFSQRLLPRT